MPDPTSTPPNPSNRRPLASRSWPVMARTAKALAAAGATPNSISVAGTLFATLGGLALALSGRPDLPGWAAVALPLAAACGVQLRLLCNLLDGMVAIEGGRQSPAGPLFNEAPDRVSDAALFIGAGLAAGSSLPAGLAAALAAVLTAYVRELARAAGAGADFSGPMAKQHRMALLTAACVLLALPTPLRDWRCDGALARILTLDASGSAGPWALTLAVITLGSLLTCARRLQRAAHRLAQLKAPP